MVIYSLFAINIITLTFTNNFFLLYYVIIFFSIVVVAVVVVSYYTQSFHQIRFT